MELTVKLKGRGTDALLLRRFKEFLYSAEEKLVDAHGVDDADQLAKSLVLEFDGQRFVLDGQQC